MASLALAGCSPAATEAGAPAPASPSASASTAEPLVIERSEAEKVFEEQLRAAAYATDKDASARAETGALYEESVAMHHRRLSPTATTMRNDMHRMEYLIPTERDQPAYPRSFVVMFRMTGKPEQDRAAGLYYFVQAEAGAPWKAAAKTWATDRPAGQPGEVVDDGLGDFDLRDKPVAALARDESGAVALSPTAAVDRSVCDRFAEYLTFTAPDGEAENPHFAADKLTSDIVTAYNDEDKNKGWSGLVRYRYAFEVTGVALPVLRLVDGKSLVTCTFVRTDRLDSKPGMSASFRFGNEGIFTAQISRLLGVDEWWLNATIRARNRIMNRAC
ncbi:hypothetical protein ACWGHA_33885 [Streptomyces xanthophaeus]